MVLPSIKRSTSGAIMSSIASPILPPGTTVVFICEINDPCSIANSRGIINPLQIAEVNHHEAFVERWNTFGGKRIRGIDRRHALEVDMGT